MNNNNEPPEDFFYLPEINFLKSNPVEKIIENQEGDFTWSEVELAHVIKKLHDLLKKVKTAWNNGGGTKLAEVCEEISKKI